MKAILEIDMPDKCLTCILADHILTDDTEILYCHVLNESVDDVGFIKRHAECPLREVEK